MVGFCVVKLYAHSTHTACFFQNRSSSITTLSHQHLFFLFLSFSDEGSYREIYRDGGNYITCMCLMGN